MKALLFLNVLIGFAAASIPNPAYIQFLEITMSLIAFKLLIGEKRTNLTDLNKKSDSFTIYRPKSNTEPN